MIVARSGVRASPSMAGEARTSRASASPSARPRGAASAPTRSTSYSSHHADRSAVTARMSRGAISSRTASCVAAARPPGREVTTTGQAGKRATRGRDLLGHRAPRVADLVEAVEQEQGAPGLGLGDHEVSRRQPGLEELVDREVDQGAVDGPRAQRRQRQVDRQRPILPGEARGAAGRDRAVAQEEALAAARATDQEGRRRLRLDQVRDAWIARAPRRQQVDDRQPSRRGGGPARRRPPDTANHCSRAAAGRSPRPGMTRPRARCG
jgi:hypothetical protein